MAGPAKYPLQTKFWKSFGRYGIFLGTVVGFLDDGLYQCYYEGDGDKENLTEEEIESWLKRYPSVVKMNQDASMEKKSTSEEAPPLDGPKRATPGKNQSIKGPPRVAAAKKRCEALEEIWKENLQKLKAFREAHGHTSVPRGWRQDPSLSNWVHEQRKNYKQGTIQPHRQALLEQVGFGFGPRIRSWNENYQLLADHKKRFGGFSNITLNGPHKNLCVWMRSQKNYYWKGCLRPDHKKLLETLGHDIFEWRRYRTWQENFDALLSYKKRHGNCNVPWKYKKDAPLGFWVNRHKKPNVYSGLNPEQKDQLKAIGFRPTVDGETVPTSSLESNAVGFPETKSKKHKAATKTSSNQAAFQTSNWATKSTRAAKQRARLKIENQVEQESSDDESASDVDSYESDELKYMEESAATAHDDTVSLMNNDAASPIGNDILLHDEEAVIAQAKERHAASEVAPNKAESSIRAQSTGAARHHQNASRMVPDLAPSATTPAAPRRSGRTNRLTRAKAVVPDAAKSETKPKDIVPDETESSSTSALPARTSPRRVRRKIQQEEEASIRKPRWLFDG